MSIASEISRISNNVQNTIDAIEAAGVDIPDGANSDNLPSLAQALANTKQDKLTGVEGQVVGFDADGNAVAQDPTDGLPEGGTEGQVLTKTASGAEWGDVPSDLPEGGTNGQILTKTSDGVAWEDAPEGGVTSFNSRTGAITPQSGDYTAEMVGARPNTWTPSAADVGAVPTTRTVNNKPLSSDVTLTAADVGAGAPATSTTVTLTSTGWTGSAAPYSQQVACSIVSATSALVTIDINTDSDDMNANIELTNAAIPVLVKKPTQGDGTLTFYTKEKPTMNIPIDVGVS